MTSRRQLFEPNLEEVDFESCLGQLVLDISKAINKINIPIPENCILDMLYEMIRFSKDLLTKGGLYIISDQKKPSLDHSTSSQIQISITIEEYEILKELFAEEIDNLKATTINLAALKSKLNKNGQKHKNLITRCIELVGLKKKFLLVEPGLYENLDIVGGSIYAKNNHFTESNYITLQLDTILTSKIRLLFFDLISTSGFNQAELIYPVIMNLISVLGSVINLTNLAITKDVDLEMPTANEQ